MKNLGIQNLYQQFQSALRSDTDSDINCGILPHLDKHQAEIDVAQRFNIYHYAYRSRLSDILASDYPKTTLLLGEEAFELLAQDYLARFPSHSPNVSHFGQHLALFLGETAPYATQPYLAEMADFEWRMGEAALAPDRPSSCPVLSADALTTVPARKLPKLRVSFDASVQLLQYHWNVPQLWQALEQQNTPSTPIHHSGAMAWLIYRVERQVFFRSMLSNMETLAFQIMQDKGNFSELCEALCAVMPESEVPHFAISCLQRWLELGLIVRLR